MDNAQLKKTVNSLFPDLDESSLDLFVEDASFMKYPKGTKLVVEGKRHNYFYLLINGVVKSYYQKESKQVCMWFATDKEFIGTLSTYGCLPSKETIELLADSELIQFNSKKVEALVQTNLAISNMIIDIFIEHALYTEERLYQLQFMTTKERYQALIETAPEILQKVSLTDIASYLGVSRETLSRIRGKK